jgi:hypothetical protein
METFTGAASEHNGDSVVERRGHISENGEVARASKRTLAAS